MSERAPRRHLRGLLAAAAVSAALLVPAVPATAAPTAAPADACEVTGGSLTWGIKESWRAYISGSIAKGAWEPLDGATYATPEFSWPATAGDIDPATGTGTIAFEGAVAFTGHNGLLQTTLANPTVVIDDAGARLLVDLSTVPMDSAMAGEQVDPTVITQVPLVTLDVTASALVTDAASVTGSAVPTVVTAEGFDAFGTYQTGTPFDPVSFAATYTCAEPEPEQTPEPEVTTAAPEVTAVPVAESTDAGVPWWGIGGGIALVVAVALGVWGLRRRGRRDEEPSA